MASIRRWVIGGILSLALINVSMGQEESGAVSLLLPGESVATFAGGCFWCMEPPFEKLPGVVSVVAGYMGGEQPDPDYQLVSSGQSGYLEVVQIRFELATISYDELLEVYWRQIDPTDDGGAFVDRGSQYRSAIFYHDAEQQRIATASKAALQASGLFAAPVVTQIRPAGQFYPAEEYHQDFYLQQPERYQRYRQGSGRDRELENLWGEASLHKSTGLRQEYIKPDNDRLKTVLTPLQYRVTQEDGTEKPFDNLYWNNKEEGIYVDVVSGEPLFSSLDKYDSGSGWPSFSHTLPGVALIKKRDTSLFSVRTEVRSRLADSHLGHLFNDGPAPSGLRYCVNSASLRFIPVNKLKEEGYGEYLPLFDR